MGEEASEAGRSAHRSSLEACRHGSHTCLARVAFTGPKPHETGLWLFCRPEALHSSHEFFDAFLVGFVFKDTVFFEVGAHHCAIGDAQLFGSVLCPHTGVYKDRH